MRWSGGTQLISAINRTEAAQATLLGAIRNFHELNPLAPGQNVAQLRQQIGLDGTAFERIVNHLIRRKQVIKEGNLLRLATHRIQFSAETEGIRGRIEEVLLSAGLNTPNLSELQTQFSDHLPDEIQKMFYALLNLGRFVKITDSYFIHADTFKKTLNLLTNYLRENGIITVAEFRELTKTSRKYAVPFLEYCDGQSITVRVENHRRLRKSEV